MAEVRAGPVPYIYVCTRMRVRKAKLLPREEYLRMLNMGLSEITRFIEETQYKKEIDELATSFHGIDLIEIALSWNLAKEYQNIQKITPGTLKDLTRAYLRKWDIQNVLTVLRGKLHGERSGKIREVLIPAGELDKHFLDRLIEEPTPERIIEALKGKGVYPLLSRSFEGGVKEEFLPRVENELYKQFYAELVSMAMSGIKGGKQFMDYITLDIDITNISNMFRFRADQSGEEMMAAIIPGGTISPQQIQRLMYIRDRNEFIDALVPLVKVRVLRELLEKLREEKSIREIEIDLIKVQLAEMESMSKLHPFSIHPILAYLEMKKYEIFNLRALARGKESNLTPDRIRGYLVI
ncbi:MAG TPA: ATP synthase A1 subunit C [Methanolinea sp.]|jgi:V/A-type H+-transporting ATPase subunit C|nr:MAG: V-type ATP synthase subunit C [Methanoregulaceae archaeon PtaB.Bin009]OPY41510.1 MAG: V-type ATP synthase subunit C [Methanoregulaceae archaeon PtaU1.Bin066]HII76603.1 ATP synthase A1 subunit C [Methanolinea sp.]HNQ30030.1 V-type ATP synthase subunit C [Methanolinea sp.]